MVLICAPHPTPGSVDCRPQARCPNEEAVVRWAVHDSLQHAGDASARQAGIGFECQAFVRERTADTEMPVIVGRLRPHH